MGLDAGLSLLDLFIVNFEPFCGNSNKVESRVLFSNSGFLNFVMHKNIEKCAVRCSNRAI